MKLFLQIVLQARFSSKLQRSRHHMMACSFQVAFKNSLTFKKSVSQVQLNRHKRTEGSRITEE